MASADLFRPMLSTSPPPEPCILDTDGGSLSLSFPSPPPSSSSEVEQVKCECCGLVEDCTHGYITSVRSAHFGRWVCGLCVEAVKEERSRGRRRRAELEFELEALDEDLEDALQAHMEFLKEERGSPVVRLGAAMRRLLRRSLDGSEGSRSTPVSPRRSASITRTTSGTDSAAQRAISS